MLVWNWIAAWLLLIIALVEYGPSAFEERCPRCGNSMVAAGRLEFLIQYANRYWGWRTFRCTHCSFQQTQLSVSRDRRVVVYQTHPVH
jgi:phage FluMu protein Com